jgi:hypothetical protein
LILSSHPFLVFLVVSFLLAFPSKSYIYCPFNFIRVTRHAHLTIFDLNILIILVEVYKLWNPSLYEVPRDFQHAGTYT